MEKDEDRVSGDDIREGLTAIISIKLAEPQFEGQTKTKLGNTEAKGFVQRVVNDQLGAVAREEPGRGPDIVRKAQAAAQARIAARKARDLARYRKGLLGGGSLPGKLSDCQSTNPDECEVFIVEGDSAGGSASQGRDPRIQAILPIRGKILNVEKARIDKVLANTEVQAIISALGTGIHETSTRQAALPQGRADGGRRRRRPAHQHAAADAALPLHAAADRGRLRLPGPAAALQAEWNKPQEHEFVYSDRSATRCCATAGRRQEAAQGDPVQRYKGLGEMNNKELWETTMDPDQRLMLQVTLDDAAHADEIFSILMGEDVERRRYFIQRNAKDVTVSRRSRKLSDWLVAPR